MQTVFLICSAFLFVLANGKPQLGNNQTLEDLGGSNMEDDYSYTETAGQIGNVLQKLPGLIQKTSNWIRDLAEIGDEVHPDVGDVIRIGADAVQQVSEQVPENIHTKVQDHLYRLINITRVVQDNVNSSLQDIPAFKDSLRELPADDVLLDVVESIPSPDYVDEQINEVINYFEPLAKAIGKEDEA